MAVRLRWREWLALGAALAVFSGCGSGATTTHPVPGATATTGAVVVSTDLKQYTTASVIGAIVTNSSKTDYLTQDGKSGCSIVVLQKFNTTTGVWDNVDPCRGGPAPRVLTVAQGSTIPYTLTPNSPSDMNAWQAGTYRVEVTYTTNADGVTGSTEAHSAAFSVHD